MILETLNQLPEIALQNIMKIPTVESVGLPKGDYMLFGHAVHLEVIEISKLQLMQKQQIILDWQDAAKNLKLTFTEKGLKEPIVVPHAVFNQVCKQCKLIQLEGMVEDGSIPLNPLVIDNILSRCLSTGLKIFPWNMGLDSKILSWWGKSGIKGLSLQESSFDARIEHPDISFAQPGEESLYLFYSYNDKGVMEYFYNCHKDKDDETWLANYKDSIDKYFGSKWDVYLMLLNEANHLAAFEKCGKVSFPELPQEFQELLYKLKAKFPNFPVYTAADPDYFALTFNGVEMMSYVGQRIEFWKNFRIEIRKKFDELKLISEKFNDELAKRLKDIGRIPSKYHFITSRHELEKVIQIEKDPIFYLPVKTVHKHVQYDFVVVYGQYGDSPHEAEAIAELQKIDQTAFIGVQAN